MMRSVKGDVIVWQLLYGQVYGKVSVLGRICVLIVLIEA